MKSASDHVNVVTYYAFSNYYYPVHTARVLVRQDRCPEFNEYSISFFSSTRILWWRGPSDDNLSNGFKKAVTCNSMAKHFYEQHSQTICVELWNMSGNVNKIPMQVFHLRSYKGCDENVTLLQACYDNPLFQQEEAKFSPDVEKKPRSKDYTPADEIPEIEFDEKNDATKRRKLCLIGFIVCCVAVIGFLVGYLVSSAKST